MLTGLVLCLVVSALAEDLPKPRFTHLSSGEIELSVDDLPGLKIHGILYKISGTVHQGLFKQAADGRWYHKNHEIKYNGKDKIEYELFGDNNGKLSAITGVINPEDSGLMISPPRIVRRGHVVFRDDFSHAFDTTHWNYEVSMYGGYNWEIQAYVPEARNIFTRNGHLFIKPTLTVDHPSYDEYKLQHGTMDMNAMYGYCTNSDRYGCVRQAPPILPPIMSGKITSKETITFGKVEVRARIPCGDWIWPAIWMLPKYSSYGQWPRSGEIDIMESRGNIVANDPGGKNHGRNEVGSTMHWGPDAGQNRFMMTHGDLDGEWCHSFHDYRLEWTIDYIQVFVDNRKMMDIPIHQSFWNWGHFGGNNIWSSGTKAAPFDKPFYLILNVAVGGTSNFFPDSWHYNSRKPWRNDSPNENADFWNAKNDWLPSWHGDDVAMEIDYVQMTQY
ncbi:hypothetical protein ACF0H5_005630 [Mactra antiquata]